MNHDSFGAKEFDKDQLAELADGARMALQIVEFEIGAVWRVDGNGSLAGGQQSTASFQFLCADAIGKETELADCGRSLRVERGVESGE